MPKHVMFIQGFARNFPKLRSFRIALKSNCCVQRQKCILQNSSFFFVAAKGYLLRFSINDRQKHFGLDDWTLMSQVRRPEICNMNLYCDSWWFAPFMPTWGVAHQPPPFQVPNFGHDWVNMKISFKWQTRMSPRSSHWFSENGRQRSLVRKEGKPRSSRI
jgi:hypothetical protein